MNSCCEQLHGQVSMFQHCLLISNPSNMTEYVMHEHSSLTCESMPGLETSRSLLAKHAYLLEESQQYSVQHYGVQDPGFLPHTILHRPMRFSSSIGELQEIAERWSDGGLGAG